MDTLLDSQELEVQRAVRELLEKESPTTLARSVERVPEGYSTDLWKQLGDLGWSGLCLPEQFGGAGMPLWYGGLIAEEVGRHLSPVPYLTTLVASYIVDTFGTFEQRQRILPGVAQHQHVLTYAVEERGGLFDPRSVTVTARREGDGFVVDGVKRFVDNFGVAQACLVACRVISAAGRDEGVALLLVDPHAPGISTTPLVTTAKDDERHVSFAGVRVASDALLGELAQGPRAAATLVDCASALLAAQMAGAARRVMEVAVAYAKIRHAFGQPIGAFQSIQHLCADMLIWVDGTELLAREALWWIANSTGPRTEASQAKSFANLRLVPTCRASQQIHGGMGFTAECEVNLYYRRVAAWAGRMGNASQHHRRIAADLLDTPGEVRLDAMPPARNWAA
ncbi:MAG TPA: acyl-CoA dehydrogenase family protein [Micromonosporaceae bacterium]